MRTFADWEVALLTPRQWEILRVAASGKSTKEMANLLGLSTLTMKNHLGNIYQRLGVGSMLEAVIWYYAGIGGPRDG